MDCRRGDGAMSGLFLEYARPLCSRLPSPTHLPDVLCINPAQLGHMSSQFNQQTGGPSHNWPPYQHPMGLPYPLPDQPLLIMNLPADTQPATPSHTLLLISTPDEPIFPDHACGSAILTICCAQPPLSTPAAHNMLSTTPPSRQIFTPGFVNIHTNAIVKTRRWDGKTSFDVRTLAPGPAIGVWDQNQWARTIAAPISC